MFVRLPRTAVLVAVLAAVWLLPSPANAAVQHHRNVQTCSCERTPVRCLAGTWHERLATQSHVSNPSSNDALDDADDRDVDSELTPAASLDGNTAVANPDASPAWVGARRSADPHAARLIIWRQLTAPRPPPSL
jgi:hypothetical protein